MGRSKVLVRSCDTTSETAVKALYEDLGTHFDKVDVLINSTGAMNAGLMGEIEPALWWENFVSIRIRITPALYPFRRSLPTDDILKEANVKSPYLMVHYFIKHFGGVGTVITISSTASFAVHPGMGAYAATKLAINRVDECLQLGK